MPRVRTDASLRSARQQLAAAREAHEICKTRGFGLCRAPAARREPVVPSPRILFVDAIDFGDPSVVEQLFEHAIQRARSEAHGAFGLFFHFLDDGVAVPFSVG